VADRALRVSDQLPDDWPDPVYVVVHERLVNPDDPWVPESPKVWTALTAVQQASGTEAILVFRSAPAAIRFVKPAIAHGFLSQAGKIAKYPRRVAETWPFALLLEPTADDMSRLRQDFIFPGPGIELD
jgi:hypothetical protein